MQCKVAHKQRPLNVSRPNQEAQQPLPLQSLQCFCCVAAGAAAAAVFSFSAFAALSKTNLEINQQLPRHLHSCAGAAAAAAVKSPP